MSAGPVPRPPSRVLRLLLSAFSALGVLALSHFALSQQATPTAPEKPYNVPLPRPSGIVHRQHPRAHQGLPVALHHGGGFVDDASVVFVDISHQAGIDKFHHRSGSPEKPTIIDAPGSGVALLDCDKDGWLDIYLLNGSTFAPRNGFESAPRAMLLHNNHDVTFTDVTDKAGVSNERWGFGVAVADDDNDRLLDLFVPDYVHYDLEHPILAGKGGVPEGACQYCGVNVGRDESHSSVLAVRAKDRQGCFSGFSGGYQSSPSP